MTQPTLSEVKNLAEQAGEILRSGFGAAHQIRHKGVIDLVTEMDQRSEAVLIKAIQQMHPDHTIVSEETGLIKGHDEHVWYIDPLDGTTNYAHGLPFFAVSIAYAEKGSVKLAVVYDPIRQECFNAELGQGAWLNDQAIQVSDTQELINSLLVTGFPYDMLSTEQNNLDNFGKFAHLTQGVRRLGSAALDLCYVACGRLDGFWEAKLKAWDIAAGALIAHESGCQVTNVNGEADYLNSPYSILAANPTMHKLMLSVLNNHH